MRSTIIVCVRDTIGRRKARSWQLLVHWHFNLFLMLVLMTYGLFSFAFTPNSFQIRPWHAEAIIGSSFLVSTFGGEEEEPSLMARKKYTNENRSRQDFKAV